MAQQMCTRPFIYVAVIYVQIGIQAMDACGQRAASASV